LEIHLARQDIRKPFQGNELEVHKVPTQRVWVTAWHLRDLECILWIKAAALQKYPMPFRTVSQKKFEVAVTTSSNECVI